MDGFIKTSRTEWKIGESVTLNCNLGEKVKERGRQHPIDKERSGAQNRNKSELSKKWTLFWASSQDKGCLAEWGVPGPLPGGDPRRKVVWLLALPLPVSKQLTMTSLDRSPQRCSEKASSLRWGGVGGESTSSISLLFGSGSNPCSSVGIRCFLGGYYFGQSMTEGEFQSLFLICPF